jgi:formyl-CoA transferase
VIAARFACLPTEAVIELLDEAAVANARLNTVQQFLDHPVLAGRDRWRTVGTPGGDIRALLPPTVLTDVRPAMNPVPAVGQHTDEILLGLGRSGEAIAALRADGVV